MKTNVFLILGVAFCLAISGARAQNRLATGSPCVEATDCYSGICDAGICKACVVGGFNCGNQEWCEATATGNRCSLPNKVLGQACTNSIQCLGELWCNPATAKCTKPVPLNGACAPDVGGGLLGVQMCGFYAYCAPYNVSNPTDGYCTTSEPFGASCTGVKTCQPQYVCPVADPQPKCTFYFARNGAQCNTDDQCSLSDYCSTNFAGPGPCLQRKKNNALCVRNRECASNQCGADGLCVPATPCSPALGLNPCGPNLICGADGVCASPLPVGNGCTGNSDCVKPNVCSLPTAGAAPGATFKYCMQCSSATPPNGIGECADPGVSPTPAGVFCAATEPIMSCQPRIATGSPCQADFQCASFKCDPSTKLCLPLPNGAICGSSKACSFSSFCPSNPVGSFGGLERRGPIFDLEERLALVPSESEVNLKSDPIGLPIQPRVCTAILNIGAHCLSDDQCFNPLAPNAPQNVFCDLNNPVSSVCTYKCDGVPGFFPPTYVCPAGYFCPSAVRNDINYVRGCVAPSPDGTPCSEDNQCLSGRCALTDASRGICIPLNNKLPDGFLCNPSIPQACYSGKCIRLDDTPFGSCAAIPLLPPNAPCLTDEQCASGLCAPMIGQTNGFCTSFAKLAGGGICTNSTQCASGVCSFNNCASFVCPYGVCTTAPSKKGINEACVNSVECKSGICRYGLLDKVGRCWAEFSPPPPPPEVIVPFFGKRNQLRQPGKNNRPPPPNWGAGGLLSGNKKKQL